MLFDLWVVQGLHFLRPSYPMSWGNALSEDFKQG